MNPRRFAIPESTDDVIGAMATILREQRVSLDDQFAVLVALNSARFSGDDIDKLVDRAIARARQGIVDPPLRTAVIDTLAKVPT